MSDRSLWTLGRDAQGYFLRFHDGGVQRLGELAGQGDLLTVAWCLGMHGPTTSAEARMLIARNREGLEIEALNYLATRVGERGPIPLEAWT
jgi:hypothetical protein